MKMTPVATDVAIITMVEQKRLFFDIIDYMDQNGRAEEIPVRLYERMLYQTLDAVAPAIKTKGTDAGRFTSRLKTESALCLTNLQRAGLVLPVDTRRGMMTLTPFVTEMFRHFDRARMRHLNSADLEAIRKDFNHSLTSMRKLSGFAAGDLQFEQEIALLRRRISNALAKMMESVESLLSQSNTLASVAESMRLEHLDEAKQAQNALRSITDIYLHSVLPTLQFLDQNQDIKGDLPALTALTQVSELLAEAGRREIGLQLLYSVAAIRSYHKDIDVIRKSLMRYVQQSEKQRREYNSIEATFNRLHTACLELHDGKLKGNKLAGDHEVLLSNPVLRGLKTWGYNAKLEWHDIDHRAVFREHMRTSVARTPGDRETIHDSGNRVDQKGYGLLSADMRLALIGEIVSGWVPVTTDDAHVAMHSLLVDRLPEFNLLDVLSSMSWLQHREDVQLTPVFRMANLETELHSLSYYQINLELKNAG